MDTCFVPLQKSSPVLSLGDKSGEVENINMMIIKREFMGKLNRSIDMVLRSNNPIVDVHIYCGLVCRSTTLSMVIYPDIWRHVVLYY